MNAPAQHTGLAPVADDLGTFASLSSWLTGFDVADAAGPALVARRYALFARETPEALRRELLAAWRRADGAADPERRRRAVADADRWAPWVRALVKLWYQGRWTSPVDGAVLTTPMDPGLMWRALGALPQGLDAPGLGRWSAPPPMTARAG